MDRSKKEKICKTLKFTNFHSVEARGTRGGMVLMWNADTHIQCTQKTKRIIKGQVQETNGAISWNLLACYGTPYTSKKKKEF